MAVQSLNGFLISNADVIWLYADDGTISPMGFVNVFVTLACPTNKQKPKV
jgi:hypothetical protein